MIAETVFVFGAAGIGAGGVWIAVGVAAAASVFTAAAAGSVMHALIVAAGRCRGIGNLSGFTAVGFGEQIRRTSFAAVGFGTVGVIVVVIAAAAVVAGKIRRRIVGGENHRLFSVVGQKVRFGKCIAADRQQYRRKG